MAGRVVGETSCCRGALEPGSQVPPARTLLLLVLHKHTKLTICSLKSCAVVRIWTAQTITWAGRSPYTCIL